MNPVVLGEEETRTIKYLNKPHQLEDQHSESLTEKQHEQEMHPIRKKHPPRNHPPNLYIDTRPHRTKVVVIEPLDHPPAATASRNLAQPKNKHKKGKSVDIEEGGVQGHYAAGYADVEGRGKVVINGEFLNGFRERGSISEMKQYNVSKKLGRVKAKQESNGGQSKRKKAHSIHEGEIKQIKKEIKSIIQASPLQLNFKKKEGSRTSSKSSRSSSNHCINKPAKNYSRSHELNTDRKPRQKSKSGISELANIAYTMPVTSKMVSLYSNTSSLFNSKAELDRPERRHSYVIPTEQSMEEIPEIREYESISLRKRSSQNLRRVSLINELTEEEPRQTTENIISHYLQLLRSHQLEFERQAMGSELEISAIPHQSSLKERNEQINSEMLGSLSMNAKLEQSEVVQPLSREINEQEEELSKLNRIIDIINSKDKDREVDKNQILLQIRSLIDANKREDHPLPPVQPPPALLRQDAPPETQPKHDLSSSELKDSLILDDNSMEGLNLQILDKTLRERQIYLLQRKERQLQRLQEQCVRRDQAWLMQRQRIEKWMDHQIKEVVHTRKQLWKGFSIAKNLIQQDARQERKNQMIRCLSDKYIARAKHSKKQNTELSRGRINEVEGTPDHSSDVEIDLRGDSDDEQLLDSSTKNNQFQEHKKELIPHNQPKVDFQIEVSSESVDSAASNPHQDSPSPHLDDSPQLLQPPSIGAPSVGLNLQRIECEVDYEDSLNSEEIQALARESEQAKGDSLRLPYALTLEDKEDIFQFIFLDLCIELTDEYGPDTTIMRRIAGFIRTMKEQARKQKGFKTNTNAIRDYLFQFITFLKNKPEQLAEVHLNIDKPLGPTALDILKYMHVYDDDPPEEEGADTVFIMDIKLFETFEQGFLAGLQFEKYYEDEEKEKKRRVFLKNAIHIHNKAIFDALNETLDRQRPFGVWGEPFSWKKAPKFYHTRDVAAKNSLILRSAQRTIEFGAYMCGFIADKEDCNLKNNPNVTQAYIDQIRDDRLSRLLANELDESEEKMLFIDDEETEILVEVAQAILHTLLAQACHQLL